MVVYRSKWLSILIFIANAVGLVCRVVVAECGRGSVHSASCNMHIGFIGPAGKRGERGSSHAAVSCALCNVHMVKLLLLACTLIRLLHVCYRLHFITCYENVTANLAVE